jgi:predicted O-linked N-acetylglucosamine transferase (SPINDLY family)
VTAPPPIQQGLAHHEAGRLAEAERVYRQILAANPDDADALHLLGVLAFQVRQYEPAIQLISRSIQLNPHFPLSHNNLGNALAAVNRRPEAAAAYERAIALKPDYAEAYSNLGTVFRDGARFADAVAAYERATRAAPSNGEIYSNLGTALKDQGRVEEAIAAYRRAVELKPDHVAAHSNLIYALNAREVDPQVLYREHVDWARRHADRFSPAPPHENTRDPDRKLRVGYIGADFRLHPVSRFLFPLFEHRDRRAFEFVCYSATEAPDAVTQMYATRADAFYSIVHQGDAEVADMIRSHGIDILVELSGHTASNRLLVLARKPAPVQFTYIGYPNTTGMRAIDYRITDAVADPPGETDGWHTEKLVRLDGCFLAYPLSIGIAPVAPPPVERNGFITFGSFNNLSKISPLTVRLWADVLSAVPRARLIIKATSLGDAPTKRLVAERLAREGLPMDRVELLGPEPSPEGHLGVYSRVDVALDTFPYNGTTTTCEALSMGVPVVSLYARHHVTRVGLSLLTAAGFGQWATDDPKRFVEIAAALANEAATLRPGMRQQLLQSTLCDGAGIARKIESAYRAAWRAWSNS